MLSMRGLVIAALCPALWAASAARADTVIDAYSQAGQAEPYSARSQAAPIQVDADAASERPRWQAAASARNGLLLPSLVAPGNRATGRAGAVLWSGYDSARQSPAVRSFVDANLYKRLDVRAGITYLPNTPQGAVQPHVGMRVRLLEQQKHGVDLGVGAFYRMERFTDDEGLIQGLLTAATRLGRLGLFGNLAYGQDPEGDDREGDVLFGLLYEVLPALQLGFETRARFDLGSTDPKRQARGDTSFDGSLAPTLSYALGPFALLAQCGVTTLHAAGWRTGALALLGVATVY